MQLISSNYDIVGHDLKGGVMVSGERRSVIVSKTFEITVEDENQARDLDKKLNKLG